VELRLWSRLDELEKRCDEMRKRVLFWREEAVTPVISLIEESKKMFIF
jgi:hypothetical protein